MKLKYGRWNKLKFKMNYNQELYKEFMERQAAKNYVKNYSHTYKRRALLQKFIELPDTLSISL